MKIADLHCDLLNHLIQDPSRSAKDPKCRASIPQLLRGQVVFQAMANFEITQSGSAAKGEKQFQAFKALPRTYKAFANQIRPFFAIENASAFSEENEPLQQSLDRLTRWRQEAGPILYISLTWNDENRFGGGNAAPKIGLKPDGKTLLHWMNGKNIAIDFSHTSDPLAHDILNTIDAKNYSIPTIASHSNFRKVADHPRNLTDEIAKEIIRRKGLIGLNFLRSFLGGRGPEDFLRQIEHSNKLGGLNASCFGADFFNDSDTPDELKHLKPFFYPRFDNSSCYPALLELLRPHLSEIQIENIAHGNIFRFYKGVIDLSN
jgi:membrane dipeptidase